MSTSISKSSQESSYDSSDSIIYRQHPRHPHATQNIAAENKDSEDSWSQGEDQGSSVQTDSVNRKTRTNPIDSAKESHANWSDDESDTNPSAHRDTVISVPVGISMSTSNDSSSDSVAMVAASTMASSVPNNLTSITQNGNLPQRSQLNLCHSRFDTEKLILGGIMTTLSSGMFGLGIYELLAGAHLTPPIGSSGSGTSQEGHTMMGAIFTFAGLSILFSVVVGWKSLAEKNN